MTITAWISGEEDMRLDINLLGWGWDKKKPRGPVGHRGGRKEFGGDLRQLLNQLWNRVCDFGFGGRP